MKNILTLLQIIIYTELLHAQHTFSIVAVDSLTKEVGSAGATCLSVDREGFEALIISDLIPGRGAIHTQSYWNAANQANADQQMYSGSTPAEIIQWLQKNDDEGNPAIRQYGIAGLDEKGHPSAAGFTGTSCLNQKKHVTGIYYSIQGNILIENYVIDSMEARFTRAKGSLADRLMEGMKGALIPGADSRCLSEGLSSRSSFLRVAKPTDPEGIFYLDIHVPSTLSGLDPIDSLDTLFKEWKKQTSTINPSTSAEIEVHYQPEFKSFFVLTKNGDINHIQKLKLYSFDGKEALSTSKISSSVFKLNQSALRGIYVLVLSNNLGDVLITKKIVIP